MPMTEQIYDELRMARDDMVSQSELYRPTSFWSEASSKIVDEIVEGGIDRFRRLSYPLAFFVPTYGTPGNAFTADQKESLCSSFTGQFPDARKAVLGLQQFVSGEASAAADYRVLVAADDRSRLPRLDTFSESTVGQPHEHFEFEGRSFSRSSLNYLLGLALLKKHLGTADVPRVVLEIGGGFGTLGEILASSGIPDFRYVDLDIPPTSHVAQYYLSSVLGQDSVTTYAGTRDCDEIIIDDLTSVSTLCAWQIEKLAGHVDLFVNFISFQEMEPDIVKNYLQHVSRLKTTWILLRNMREGKQKRSDGHEFGVDVPILAEDYLAMLPDYELIDRNVTPFGFRTVDGFHSELFLLKRRR